LVRHILNSSSIEECDYGRQRWEEEQGKNMKKMTIYTDLLNEPVRTALLLAAVTDGISNDHGSAANPK